MTNKPTPLMRQWMEAKRNQRDAWVFLRVGDFYELFHDDAKEAAREYPKLGAPASEKKRPASREAVSCR